MKLLEAGQWKKLRNEELAKLFYYSLSFHNNDLVDNVIKQWMTNYNEINSLFYAIDISSNEKDLENVPLVALSVLKMPVTLFNNFTPQFFDSLKKLGFVLHKDLAYVVAIQSIINNNLLSLDYTVDYFDLNKVYKTVVRTVINDRTKKETLDCIFLSDKTKNLQKDLIAYTILYSCSVNKNHFLEYLFNTDKTLLKEGMIYAQEVLEKNENIVHMRTREGIIGEKSQVETVLSHIKLYYGLHSDMSLNLQSTNKMKI